MEESVERLNEHLEDIVNCLDISKRVLIVSPDEVLFPIISKANILYKFSLLQNGDVFTLTATVSEWDDKRNCEVDVNEAEDIALQRQENEDSDSVDINNQILCLIEEITDKIGLEIISEPEEINTKMD